MNISPLRDHAQYPRCREQCITAPHCGHAANPLCSDAFDVGIVVDAQGYITSCTFSGDGCALAVGSASLLCLYVCGKKGEDVMGDPYAHLCGERVGPMREGCILVAPHALARAWKKYVEHQ